MSEERVIDIKKGGKGKAPLIAVIAVIAVFAIIAIFASVKIVPAGCTGVVTTFGEVSDTSLTEGLHFVIPFAQKVEIISNKIQIYETTADAVSKDLQSVSTKIAVNYRIRSEASARIFRDIGVDYKDVILMPTVQEGMKSVCAKYNAEQLISQRASVAEEIKVELEGKVSEYGIEIEKFNIVNFDFSKEFNEAIEAKQVAEQNLIKTRTEQNQAIVVAEAEAKKKVIQAEADAQNRVITAEAEAKAIKAKADAQAEANKTISASLNPSLIQYQTLEKWNGVLPKVAGSANPLVSLDLDDNSTSSGTAQSSTR
ncbi:MAG: prohibitin family protein [Ruminococcus sp.]|nr:prohibitin family protein [Ruminococcus sp.]